MDRAEKYPRFWDPLTQNDIPTASYNPAVRWPVLESRFYFNRSSITDSPGNPITSPFLNTGRGTASALCTASNK